MKTNLLFRIVLGISICLCTTNAKAQIVVSENITVTELVDDFFNSGVLVGVSNVTFNGMSGDVVNNQIALFSNGQNEGFSVDSGLVMGTASAIGLLTTSWESLENPLSNDPDMALIANGANVNDCAVLEFDVLVSADALAFNYVFGSLEYSGFTCSVFNDAFGLFISGPGIEGPYSNNSFNIATIPDSNTPVSINTVNSGIPSGGNLEQVCMDANPNWQADTVYFVQNSGNVASSITMNGYTVNLEAYVDVEFGETYHLKFAICDVFDGALDSGVFLETGSFEGRLLSSTDNPEIRDLVLFPNPATDELNIQLDAAGQNQFTIRDVQGRLVKSISSNGSETVTISVQDLDLGFYIINQYVDGGLVARSKFVKE